MWWCCVIVVFVFIMCAYSFWPFIRLMWLSFGSCLVIFSISFQSYCVYGHLRGALCSPHFPSTKQEDVLFPDVCETNVCQNKSNPKREANLSLSLSGWLAESRCIHLRCVCIFHEIWKCNVLICFVFLCLCADCWCLYKNVICCCSQHLPFSRREWAFIPNHKHHHWLSWNTRRTKLRCFHYCLIHRGWFIISVVPCSARPGVSHVRNGSWWNGITTTESRTKENRES